MCFCRLLILSACFYCGLMSSFFCIWQKCRRGRDITERGREGERGGVCNIVLWGPQKCSVCVSSSANISIILASYFAIRLCNDIQVISQRQYLLPVSHVVVCTYFYGTVLAKTFFSSFIFPLAVLLFFTAPTEPVQTGLIWGIFTDYLMANVEIK